MGAARSALSGVVRAQVQTQRQLDKTLERKPTPAPKHETTKQLIATAQHENRAKFEAHNERNKEYIDLLKNIKVHSVNVTEQNVPSKEKITASDGGKLTSEQLKSLFEQRMADPQQWKSENIAAHYKLSLDTAENLLKYYSDFHVQVAPKIPEPLA